MSIALKNSSNPATGPITAPPAGASPTAGGATRSFLQSRTQMWSLTKRVLRKGWTRRNPLLEGSSFFSIFSANLDEFS